MPTGPNISQGGVRGLEGLEEQGEADRLSSMGPRGTMVPVAGRVLERSVALLWLGSEGLL